MPASDEPVRIDMIRNCPVCGVPCRGEVHFEALPAAVRHRFETDRQAIDEALGRLVDQANADEAYHQLPDFVRAWNELRGWSDEGARVPADQVLTTAQAVLTAGLDAEETQIWEALQHFVRQAIAQGGDTIWVGED